MLKCKSGIQQKQNTRRFLSLGSVSEQLGLYTGASKVLGLLDAHFAGEAICSYKDFPGKWETFTVTMFYEFLKFVKRDDWFEVDENLMHWLYDGWLYEDAYYFFEGISNFFDYMPIRFFGTGSHTIFDNKGLSLLRGLLNADYLLPSEYLIRYEIYDNIDNKYKRDLYEATQDNDYEYFRSPLRYLPEIIRVICKETDNVILDNDDKNIEVDDWMIYPMLDWKSDLEMVRRDWQEAKPIIKKLDEFMAWLNDDEANVDKMFEVVLSYDG